MHLPWRDLIATLLVAASLVAYAMWAVGAAIPGFGDVPTVAVAPLALGVAASISAVVPGFDELLRGSRLYLAGASGLGLVALGAGLWALVGRDANGLALLVLTTIALWAVSTMRHLGVHFRQPRLGHL